MGKFQTSNTDLDYRFQTYFSIYRIVLVFAVDPETNMNLFSFGSRLCCKYPVGMCIYIYSPTPAGARGSLCNSGNRNKNEINKTTTKQQQTNKQTTNKQQTNNKQPNNQTTKQTNKLYFTRSATNMLQQQWGQVTAKLLALFWTNAIGQIDGIYNTWFYCRSFYTIDEINISI